jgi:hypothetical protein
MKLSNETKSLMMYTAGDYILLIPFVLNLDINHTILCHVSASLIIGFFAGLLDSIGRILYKFKNEINKKIK